MDKELEGIIARWLKPFVEAGFTEGAINCIIKDIATAITEWMKKEGYEKVNKKSHNVDEFYKE